MTKKEASRLTLIAALALVFLGAMGGAAYAGGEVGIEAQGVSPWAVLHNRWNLDIRDAMNRPVSRRLVESQLKAAATREVVENTYASRLPKARAMAAVLEVVRLVPSVWRGVAALPPHRSIWALPLGRRGAPRILMAALFLLPAALFETLLSLNSCISERHACAIPLVLRC